MRRDIKAIKAAFEKRTALLEEIARALEEDLKSILSNIPHIDRVSFRTKSVESFLEKAVATTPDGKPKYAYPLEEIEDQVAGQVLVFYRPDIGSVLAAIDDKWRKAEHDIRKPASRSQFDYETTHRVCVITPDMRPKGWSALAEPPTTFELQIRTLAQHAWSEPQHAFYKNKGGLKENSERKLYWAAASAWGMDSIWEELQQELLHLHEPT